MDTPFARINIKQHLPSLRGPMNGRSGNHGNCAAGRVLPGLVTDAFSISVDCATDAGGTDPNAETALKSKLAVAIDTD
jgi:hypothetical protein